MTDNLSLKKKEKLITQSGRSFTVRLREGLFRCFLLHRPRSHTERSEALKTEKGEVKISTPLLEGFCVSHGNHSRVWFVKRC